MTVATHWAALPNGQEKYACTLSAGNTFTLRFRSIFPFTSERYLDPRDLYCSYSVLGKTRNFHSANIPYFYLGVNLSFDKIDNFVLHSEKTADVERIARAVGFALDAIETVVHVAADERHAHIARETGHFAL